MISQLQNWHQPEKGEPEKYLFVQMQTSELIVTRCERNLIQHHHRCHGPWFTILTWAQDLFKMICGHNATVGGK